MLQKLRLKIVERFGMPVYSGLVLMVMCCFSCSKKLDIKPNQSFLIPSTLQDFQALADNATMNTSLPQLGEAGADNYYLLDARWISMSETDAETYVWAKDLNLGLTVNDWNQSYSKVFYANAILEGLAKLSTSDTVAYNTVKGSALFNRAHAFYLLAQLFCKPYMQNTASGDVGLPLKLSADINDQVSRSTVKQTYDRIILDLKESELILPSTSPYKTRPTKAAADALLARVYLSMSDYEQALSYANKALNIYSTLLDYNLLNPAASNPFTLYNAEVIFHGQFLIGNIFSPGNYYVDSTLYASYNNDDLRKIVFFNTPSGGRVTYKGSYSGNYYYLFGGIAVDEIMLIAAECYARKGMTTEALTLLNGLLEKRWKQGSFVPFTAGTAAEALNIILSERRKELLFRGLRWTDLRRLNQDAAYAITLSRKIDNQVYNLPPNDLRYVYPIPDQEINLSGITQNPR